MSEIITHIYDWSGNEDDRYNEGFQIRTNRQLITLGMDAGGQCCEVFGYFMSEDNFTNFIGAELRDITLTDTELKTYTDLEGYGEYTDTMFVNLHTDRGVLQFVAYNSHNGYYGHNAFVRSEQLQHTEIL